MHVKKFNANTILLTSAAISILIVASSVAYYLAFYIPARDKVTSEQKNLQLSVPTLTPTPIIKVRQEVIVATPLPTVTPTPVPKTAVFLNLNSKTYYCMPAGVDAIKSADSAATKALAEYKTCLTQSTMAYASCTSGCTSEECRNSCKDRYYYEKWCNVPDDKALVNLINQYCN